MTKNNKYLIPKIEEVRKIEEKELTIFEQQTKTIDYFKERQNSINSKSKLSPAARNKIIKKYGSVIKE